MAVRTRLFFLPARAHYSLLSFNGRLFMYEIYTAICMYMYVYLRKNNDGDCDLQHFIYGVCVIRK